MLEPSGRVEAGNVLAQLGDPRFDPEMWYLPVGEELGFVRIPGGEFWLGSDKKRDPEAVDDELRHRVELSEYWLARYPLTVAQYRVFAEDTGRELDDQWRTYNKFENHPVVEVNWHDAQAYCQWLTGKLQGRGWRITLPTEAQWERAARGGDERIYPWGDGLDLNKANYGSGRKGIGTTSPVGCYPAVAAPDGVMDMAGNVWEWCADWFDEYPQEAVPRPRRFCSQYRPWPAFCRPLEWL